MCALYGNHYAIDAIDQLVISFTDEQASQGERFLLSKSRITYDLFSEKLGAHENALEKDSRAGE